VAVRLGVGDALVEEESVELVEALHPDTRGEEALAHEADLVLDLALLPTRGRRAGDRVDEVVAAHLQEATIVGALAPDEDRLDCGLHVVVDAAPAGALEEGEGPVVGVEHHLLALAGIGAHEEHAGVAEPDMGDPDLHRDPADEHDLVAPVELEGLAGSEGEWDEGLGRDGLALTPPASGVATNCIVAALIAQATQGLVDPDQGEALAWGPGGIGGQQAVELVLPSAELWHGLDGALVGERGRARADDLADRVAGDVELAADLLDGAATDEELPPDARNRVHALHLPPPIHDPGMGSMRKPPKEGSRLDADPPT
jgi:hypothetical protein